MHPEGTRGKGPDPYTFLPAQPGVGKLALVARPVVVPAFIHGLGNNILQDIGWNFGKDARKSHAVIAVFGPPVDYSDLAAEKPRPTLYKKCADRFMAQIKTLSVREREIRAEVDAGQLTDNDPRWLDSRGAHKLYAREG
jgi:1-acyl-sn-glycerol-3-phosphate acyltransferase